MPKKSDDTAGNPQFTTVNREVFETRRKALGLNDVELADIAEISVRTIERARSGKPIRIKKAYFLAKALGVPLNTLIRGFDPAIPEPENSNLRFEVWIYLSTPYAQMREPKTLEVKLALLRKVIAGTDTPKYIEMHNGSTRLTLKMLNADILRLLAAMMDGDLANLDVIRITIPDYSWIVRMIALLQLRGNPSEPDDETWDELLNVGEIDRLQMRTPGCFMCKSRLQ